MDAYDTRCAPKAFGLNNTGVICYFNSFLQMLASCTAFTRGVILNADYLRRTATGTAVVNFVTAYAAAYPANGACEALVETRDHPINGIELLSSAVLRALVADLAVRRPHVCFGGGQESASEALVHLLDMMEPPSAASSAAASGGPVMSDPALAVESASSPITSLFLHRFRCDVHCRKCKNIVSKTTDYAVNFNLFHFDRMRPPPATVADFSKAVRLQASTTEDYRCPACPCAACGASSIEGKCPACKTAAPPTTAFRIYNLTMVPEIVFCMFNLYVEYGGVRHARYFPERLEFPAQGGGLLAYLLVGQVEHAGALSGGHYWARGLRADGRVYLLNDTGVTPSSFAPTPNTYIVAYHYMGREASPA